jgi:hypothetical protein
MRDSLPSKPAERVRDQWTWRSATTFAHTIPLMAVVAALMWYGSALIGTGSHALTDARTPTVQPTATITPMPDMRHVAIPKAIAWVMEGSSYVSSMILPQFSTVRVLRSAADPQFVVGQTRDGKTVAVASSALASGDGYEARIRWCRQQSQVSPENNEVLKQSRAGRNRVIIENLGNFDAVAKFRGVDGTIVVSFFVAANSTAAFDGFPDGSYRLEFATGHEWSRRCNAFLQDMRAARFPGFDSFVSVGGYSGFSYTITPVAGGNVKTEPLSLDDFEADDG